MEVAVRLYQPLKPVIDTHSFLVGSYQGGESDTLGTILIHRGKTTMYDLRKLIEETRKGTTNMRSRMFEDMIYYFNDAPNIHGKPEARRRKYVFGIVPARQKDYDDSKVQTMQPVVVAADAERELFADQLLTRYNNEKLTVLVIQEFWIGPGCGEVCAYRECLKCAEWWERTHGAVSATSEPSVPSTVK